MSSRLALLFCAVLFFASLERAAAEYRVFLLKIEKAPTAPPSPGTSPAPTDETSAPRIRYVESNLDPWQYRGYYPVADDETITYVDTWRCRGRTDNREFCPNPRAPASVEGGSPSAQGPESRPPSGSP